VGYVNAGLLYIHANKNILVLTKGKSSFWSVESLCHALCLLPKL